MLELRRSLDEQMQVLKNGMNVFHKHMNEQLRPLYTHLQKQYQIMRSDLQPLLPRAGRKSHAELERDS